MKLRTLNNYDNQEDSKTSKREIVKYLALLAVIMLALGTLGFFIVSFIYGTFIVK